MIFAILGVAIGILLGLVVPITYSSEYSVYMSIIVLISLDTVIGGIRSNMKSEFDNAIFLTGLLTNSIMAIFLTYIGEVLGVPLYYAGIVYFGSRIFKNTSLVRRTLLERKRGLE